MGFLTFTEGRWVVPSSRFCSTIFSFRVLIVVLHFCGIEYVMKFPILATCGIENDVKIWAPQATDIPSVPENVEEIMEANRHGRKDRSRVTLTPDVVVHVLRLQRRQTLAYIERSYSRADIVSDEEDLEGYF
ncbi:hypothetical protein QN277_018329 [Acacia crassicarpa]|uniref:Uncharacterized protein n=1 Tax=Acacia crassicarpa TaxID=499986 RepID=A0AAE1JW87_9FABA|nr:hypothetical protein QN277_018329 [Acacia crassicarpa]